MHLLYCKNCGGSRQMDYEGPLIRESDKLVHERLIHLREMSLFTCKACKSTLAFDLGPSSVDPEGAFAH